MIKSP